MIRIPTRNFLRLFLLTKLKAEKITMQYITNDDLIKEKDPGKRTELEHLKHITDIIYNVGIFKSWQNKSDKEIKAKYNSFIGIEPTDNMLREKTIYIDMVGVRIFNDKIHEWFVYELIQHMDSVKSNNKEQQAGFYDFMNEYNLQFEDISYDALKKAYYRNRAKIVKSVFKMTKHSQFELDFSLADNLVDPRK